MTYHRPAVIHLLAIGLALVAAACGGNSSESTGVRQQQYGVNGTPTFIIGSQTIVGAWPFATFDAVLKSPTQ